jgi:hypothetical protein
MRKDAMTCEGILDQLHSARSEHDEQTLLTPTRKTTDVLSQLQESQRSNIECQHLRHDKESYLEVAKYFPSGENCKSLTNA